MFFPWLNAVRKEFRTLMTGSLLLTAMGFAQGLWQVPIPRWCYVAVIGCFLTWAFYRTWLKEHSAFETFSLAKVKEIESVRDEKNTEIAALKERFAQLGRKPYTEDLERIVRQLIDHQMTFQGRHLLRQLMIRERIEVGQVFVPEISQEHQQEQLAVAMQQGVVRHTDESRGGALHTYWTISPQFRSVLQDLLYEGGRL